MSRVGKKVITIPAKTSVDYKDRVLVVKGEKGTLTRTIHPAVDLEILRQPGPGEIRQSGEDVGEIADLLGHLVTTSAGPQGLLNWVEEWT